ncbi:MAG: holo-ACP synthase [Halanaerobiaceae bacterium]
MIKGMGVDLVEVSRIKRIMEKWEDKFLQRIFTVSEIKYCRKSRGTARKFAARFAAKEAVLKMLGTGLRQGITWQDIEVQNDQLGKPEINLSGQAEKIMHQKHINRIHVSLSHENKFAIAQVIGEEVNNGYSDSRTNAKDGQTDY